MSLSAARRSLPQPRPHCDTPPETSAATAPKTRLFGATAPFDHSRRIGPIVPPCGIDPLHGMARITPDAVLDAVRARLRPAA